MKILESGTDDESETFWEALEAKIQLHLLMMVVVMLLKKKKQKQNYNYIVCQISRKWKKKKVI